MSIRIGIVLSRGASTCAELSARARKLVIVIDHAWLVGLQGVLLAPDCLLLLDRIIRLCFTYGAH